MKIAKIVDQYGWAYYFLDKEQQKYSKHEILVNKPGDVELEGLDVLYIHGPDISPEARELCFKAKDLGITVIGGHAGPIPNLCPYPYLDLAVGISPQTFNYCLENYSCPSIFLPEGVDTSFFVPFRRDRAISTWRKCNWRCAGEKSPIPSVTKRGGTRHSLIVGWAGRLDNVKRPHLLDQLDFKVNIQSQHGAQYFVERSLDHMLRFYNSIDVLVLTSLSECMPRVVLEACACSIPVVCTDVGSIRMILDSKWIVPVNPESVVIEEMNKRLHLLGDKDLRDRVGDANRKRVEKTLSWKNLMPFWDTAFLAAIQKDTSSIQQINQHFGINQL